MEMSALKNLKTRLKEIQGTLDNLKSLTQDDWECLTEEQRVDMVRDIVGVRNILNTTSDRYYEF